jgi:hypothetical protein
MLLMYEDVCLHTPAVAEGEDVGVLSVLQRVLVHVHPPL